MRLKGNVGLFAMLFSVATIGMAQAPAPPPVQTKPGLTIMSTAFDDGGIIPNKYTQASPTPPSPELKWSHVPDGTVSFTLMLIDPDTALNKTTDMVLHWLIFNVPATATGLPEGVAHDAQLADGSVQGLNRSKNVGYMGMGAGALGPYHHYTYELYALDTKLTLGPDATRADVMAAMSGHILGKGILVGRFHRP
jgi:Raf kinase inhibitor-like YbhB/YbcL family protein